MGSQKKGPADREGSGNRSSRRPDPDNERGRVVVSDEEGEPQPEHRRKSGLGLLTLGALGVVFGDIGTSPLYALREAFASEAAHVSPTPENVLGILSLVFWALTLVIVVKYLIFVLRADNDGEGGILALLALIVPFATTKRKWAVLLALFGAALLYGEGVITPAISVLSAVEGLEVATPALSSFVVPITIVILLGLFLVQRIGTTKVGFVFGPITLVWFVSLAILGIRGIFHHPSVLLAVNPWYAVMFFVNNGMTAYLILGAVVLVITGAEALYADLGHFGIEPIRIGWFAIVFPSLLLNYFGQGALLLEDPTAITHPFFALVPEPLLYPMVFLAMAATIIASQALISGSFSITRQAIQLGYFPRVTIVHTSAKEEGQIYIPLINSALMIGCIALVLGFRKATNLAAAYGLAVVGTMAIGTILFYLVATLRWEWKKSKAITLAVIFLTIEMALLGANAFKLLHGAWLPLVMGAVVFVMMTTWKRGRMLLSEKFEKGSLPVELFVNEITQKPPHRVPGAAVFLTANPHGVPPVLLHHLKHNKVLHETVILLSMMTDEVPHVTRRDRLSVHDLGAGMYRVQARYGFMESPDVQELVNLARRYKLHLKLNETTFYLGRETLITKSSKGMARWRKRLFALMQRNAQSATAFFNIPPNRVVELGAQIEV